MVSKTYPAVPPASVQLETIYEESGGSLSSSKVDIQPQLDNREHASIYWPSEVFHGLISARSIPTVDDVHRRRHANKYQQKPPIEVRYRDGTKRYIQPTLTTTPMIVKRRKYSRSSNHDSSLLTKIFNTKSRQLLNTTPKKKKKKLSTRPGILLTIITADELSQAGITPPSTSSLEDSDPLALSKSHSNSSLDTLKAVKDVSFNDSDKTTTSKVPVATISPSVQPVRQDVDISVSNKPLITAPRHRSQHNQPTMRSREIPVIRSLSLPPSQANSTSSVQQKSTLNQMPPVAVVPPSQKRTPSLQIKLTTDENETKPSTTNNISKTTIFISKPVDEKKNSDHQCLQSLPVASLVGGGSRSAFRPFLKPTTFNPQPRVSLTMNVLQSQIPSEQSKTKNSSKQQVTSSHAHLQLSRPASLSSMTRCTLPPSSSINIRPHDRRAISSDALKQSVRPNVSNHTVSDKVISFSSRKTSTYQQPPSRISTVKIINNSTDQVSTTNNHTKTIDKGEVVIDPNLTWYSVTSSSLYEIPRLSNKYPNVPLHITLPDSSPTHNQKLLKTHNVALESRLLNAGLSPETIALYERILEVGDISRVGIDSPPEIVDQYHSKSYL